MDKPTAGVGAAQKIEKQARQLAYDTRYKVKQSMKAAPGSKLNPAQVAKAYLAQLAKSSAAPAVKARAKQMLTGNVKEEVMSSVDPKDMATDAVASALYKVFVEKKEDNLEEQIAELKEAYSKVNKKGDRIYHVIVKDKKTGNTYTRDATREKIAELRANPNIASVEMSERRLDSDKEKSKGANTAAVKAGKGLDPVGQEDGDIDNDGDKDKSDKYLLNRRQARGAAIAKRKGVAEAFLGEVNTEKSNPDANGKKIDVMKGQNKVVIAPEVPGSGNKSSSFMQVAHYDMQGNPLSESEMKLAKMVQEKMNLAKTRMGDVVTDFYGSDAPQFKGKSKKKRREMAVAAKLEADRKAGMKEAAEPRGGGRAPTLPAAEKFIDELPGKVQQIFGAKTKPSKPVKPVKEETVAQADKKAKKEQDEMDPRSIPTAVNLAKNKLRAIGLKCSYEPEGKQIDEVWPLVAAGAALAAPAIIKAVADKPVKKALDAASKNPNRPLLTGGTVGDLEKAKAGMREEIEVIDERTRERKGQPRPERNRATEFVRNLPDVKKGLMTRSGRTVAQHEADRGVKKEPGAPTPTGETTADRLAAKKKRAAAAQASVQRAREDEDRRRRLA